MSARFPRWLGEQPDLFRVPPAFLKRFAMGYPENVLAVDEQVVLHRHPHWKRLISPVLVLMVASGVAAFGIGFPSAI